MRNAALGPRLLRLATRGVDRFFDDGRIKLTNNDSERELRRVATGRKAWMFIGSDDHAQAAGNLLTLVASARLHKLDPEVCLRDLFRVVPHWPNGRYLELCPRDWATTRARLDPAQLEQELGADSTSRRRSRRSSRPRTERIAVVTRSRCHHPPSTGRTGLVHRIRGHDLIERQFLATRERGKLARLQSVCRVRSTPAARGPHRSYDQARLTRRARRPPRSARTPPGHARRRKAVALAVRRRRGHARATRCQPRA